MTLPDTKSDDLLADAGHAEDFLPSSLSDLLTPAELERRTRSSRDAATTSLLPLASDLVSQSLPVGAGYMSSRLGASSPGHVPSLGNSNLRSFMNGFAPHRRPGTHSVHASPFMPPILDHTLSSPPNLSPPGALSSSLGGERVLSTSMSSMRKVSDDARRRSVSGHGTPFLHGRGHVPPISPAILPVSEEDADDAIFELE